MLVREKKIIECLHELGVTSTYDEVRRFKISAAKHASKDDQVLESRKGLIQGSSDNFDTDLSTQNEIKQTHSLATIISQSINSSHDLTDYMSRDPIPRLKKEELSSVKLSEPETKIFKGIKKPKMPSFSMPKFALLDFKGDESLVELPEASTGIEMPSLKIIAKKCGINIQGVRKPETMGKKLTTTEVTTITM